ncbi:ac145 [Psilogramma increta granulovirus]|uniref:Ac145 n=1 Tax=Psilogramma increta granulovirus TaxID=2953508 RepID=A0A977TNK8_9BBAC|nr:ac145 [Psilogramma increta granulovirus]
MDILNFSTGFFVVFIVVKIIIYLGIKKLQTHTFIKDRVCINGYYGTVADPFECDSYYQCPEGLKFYCNVDEEFNADKNECVSINVENNGGGCYETAKKRLLD